MARFNKYYIAALGALILGLVLLAIDVTRGQASAGIIVIIPYITHSGILSFLGVICIVCAFLLFYAGIAHSGYTSYDENEIIGASPRSSEVQSPEREGTIGKTRRRWGGVVLIGPIPIIFGSDKRTTLIALSIALTLLAIAFFVVLYFIRFT
jgi:uncharacterized protein (TIGR00304 family)